MDDNKRIALRLLADLYARLSDQAGRDRRSLNSETVHLLETAPDDSGSPPGESARLPRHAEDRLPPRSGDRGIP
ncbi:hypothetical protein ABH917_002170 [Thermobifida halotolerans]|uniref:hypothetical protein n=1 Tax=Thermobifida halotolerans TaxID=483545 RepID=UPI001B87209D|nr:hypothetical protein [Thermobifida halotolerans]